MNQIINTFHSILLIQTSRTSSIQLLVRLSEDVYYNLFEETLVQLYDVEFENAFMYKIILNSNETEIDQLY